MAMAAIGKIRATTGTRESKAPLLVESAVAMLPPPTIGAEIYSLTSTKPVNRAPRLLVAIDLLALLVALLRFHRERGDRAGFEPLQRDRFAGLLAIAVGVVVDALQRRVDLGDQLALAVARPQFDRAVGLGGSAIGEIGMVDVLFLQRLQRDARFPQDLVLPCQKLGAKIIALPVVHERLFFGRSVVLQLFQGQPIRACKAAEKGRPRRALYSGVL